MDQQKAHLVRNFQSAVGNPLVLDADPTWRAFGRDDVGKFDQSVSRTHLEFCARTPVAALAHRGFEWLVRHKGSQVPSFVRRRRRAAAATADGEVWDDEWWLVPSAHAPDDAEPPPPLRLEHGDRIFVVGKLSPHERLLGAPLARPPDDVRYELIFELHPPPPDESGGVSADAEMAPSTSGGADGSQEEEAAVGPVPEALLAAVLAELDFPREEPGVSVKESGLRALDRACDLAVRLEARAAELRAIEERLGKQLAQAQADMLQAGATLARREAELFLDVAPILASKERRLVELEQG